MPNYREGDELQFSGRVTTVRQHPGGAWLLLQVGDTAIEVPAAIEAEITSRRSPAEAAYLVSAEAGESFADLPAEAQQVWERIASAAVTAASDD